MICRYIPAEELPSQYGGFKRENDFEFSKEDAAVSEITIKAGSTETIEIPADEVLFLSCSNSIELVSGSGFIIAPNG